MSIAKFVAATREAAFKNWFKASRKNILAKPAKEYRKSAESTKSTNLFLDTETLIQIAEKLTGRLIKPDEVEVITGELLGMVDGKRNLLIQEEVEDGKRVVTGVYFRQISFESGINRVLDNSLKSIKDRVLIEENGKTRPARVSDFFQKGHVFGVATNVTTQTLRNLAKSRVSEESKRTLLTGLIRVRNALLRADLETANIKDVKFSLYSKYLKTPYKYLVEIQVKETNREAGDYSKVLTNALRRYYNPEAVASSISKDLRERSSEGDAFFKKLLEAEGSPSYKSMVVSKIVDTLRGKKGPIKSYTVPLSKVTDISRKIDVSSLKKQNTKALNQINRAISTARNIQPSIIKNDNITSLEAILRQGLVEQVKKNMGSGNRTDVLNLRTGRFAESVELQRLSQSRAGMITAFYSYMKNPYATFSRGGAQQRPYSRDPKLLISKSIRELAAPVVANRLRAVAV